MSTNAASAFMWVPAYLLLLSFLQQLTMHAPAAKKKCSISSPGISQPLVQIFSNSGPAVKVETRKRPSVTTIGDHVAMLQFLYDGMQAMQRRF